MFKYIVSFIFILAFHTAKETVAAALGDYRTLASGSWNSTASWQCYDGTSWVNATVVPSNSVGMINILNNHTLTVTANTTIDQATVDAGGAIIISSGSQLTINSGSGDDLIVNGSLTINGTLNNSGGTTMILSGLMVLSNGGSHSMNGGATLAVNSGGVYRREDSSMPVNAGFITFNSGSTYQHNLNGQNIPEATWNTGSICDITGVTTTKPGKLDQSFYTFNWNCPNQTTVENLGGKLEVINGDFNFTSSGTGSVRLGHGDNYTLNIAGNYNHQGGSLYATSKSLLCSITIQGNYTQTGGTFAGTVSVQDKGEGSPTINVQGNFSISSGTFDFNQYTDNSAGKGITSMYLYGNFTQTGGTITETATQTGRGELYFSKSGLQYFSKSAGTISNTINCTVNSGSVTDFGTSALTGGGTFSLLSGGGLNIGSSAGITQTSALGNIQVSGTRSYSTGGFYTYNGTATQVTGDGIPSTVSKLKADNINHITLTKTVSVSDTMTFSSGNIITLFDTLIIGTSTGALGSLKRTSGHVVGYLKRWIAASATSNILFPVGATDYYEGINYSFTVAPVTGGSIMATYSPVDPGKLGLNLFESPDSIVNIGFGLWTATAGNGLTGGTFNIDITATALPSVSDYTKLRILRRANSISPWTLAGTHSPGTGSNVIPVVHRTGLTSHGQFGIGSGSSNPLPVELLYFKAEKTDVDILISWATAVEINNDFFTVERSGNGIDFENILKVDGSGNSSFTLLYDAVDPSPLSGNNFYRLKQTDFDGQITYSETVKVRFKEEIRNESEVEILSIYPNPFNYKFVVQLYTKQECNIELRLVGLNGMIVIEDKIHLTEGINQYQSQDNKHLPTGTYLLSLICNGHRINQKIIKY